MYAICVHINMHACVCLCIHMHVYAHKYTTCTSWHFSGCEHFRGCERVHRRTCQSMPASRWRDLSLRCVWSMLTIEHTIVITSCVQRFEEERVGTQHLSYVYMFQVGQPGRGRVRSARSREQTLGGLKNDDAPSVSVSVLLSLHLFMTHLKFLTIQLQTS